MSTESVPGSTLPWIISVDDHVIEPPHVWTDRLPRKYLDVAPRIERHHLEHMSFEGAQHSFSIGSEGPLVDFWRYEDKLIPHRRVVVAVTFEKDALDFSGVTYDEMRPGCYEPKARLADMDMAHVEASMCFPTFPRFCGQTFNEAKDKELALLCVQAYNDFMVDEWCGDSGGRLIPLCIVPLWTAELAAAEVRRNAARGVRAVCFSEIPAYLGLPSIHSPDHYWEPFFRACAETHTVVCMHIGSSSKMPSTSADAPVTVGAALTFNNAPMSMADYLMSGWLVKYPDLKLAYSEGQIGWIPFILERCDDVWSQHLWTGAQAVLPEPPSTYYFRQIYGCFFRDQHGIDNLESVGVDNVTFEMDYPHTDSTWPNTHVVGEQMFAGLEPEVVYKLVRGNAIRMLGLDLDRASR